MRLTLKRINNKKGEDDWKVWNRVNDFLFDYMVAKKHSKFSPAKLRSDIEVIIVIKEGK
jgi:hypothetical protein